ncbi:hypothetical protein M5K25_022535 [Dendrobium thyrsiflorum]|uniref:Uncharacterized protein n=1 Tax=Dendrobium thyrsiflorum TaxID=117978 RepID=A0ABD0UCM4_DENTH
MPIKWSMIKGIDIDRPFKPLQNTPDLSLIYCPCHSQKTINRPLISHKRGPKQEEKKRRGEEEKKRRREGRDSSSTTAGVPLDRHLMPEFRRTTT